jgi:hypothetical protein
MVGAVGLSLAGSFPGGMNAPTGFFLAFAVAFLIGSGAVLFVRQGGFDGDTYGSEPPGGSGPGPRGPTYPVDPGGDLEQGRPTRWKRSPVTRGEEDPPGR